MVLAAARFYIDHCNIVNNIYDDADNTGLIWWSMCHPIEFRLYVFASSTGKYLFFNQYGALYQCNIVNNCVNLLASTESKIINKTKKFVLNLHHLSTQECVDFPLMHFIFQQKKKKFFFVNRIL